jgi:hypothetical protein
MSRNDIQSAKLSDHVREKIKKILLDNYKERMRRLLEWVCVATRANGTKSVLYIVCTVAQ